MSRLQANLCLLLAGAIWGGGFVVQSSAMKSLGPLWFIGLRFLVATIAVAPFAWREAGRAAKPVAPRTYFAFTAIGLALFAGALTQQIGLLTTTVTNSGFLTGLYVIMVPILTVVILRRAPHWIIWPAATLALTGIFLLSGGSLTSLSYGDVMTIVCAFFWSVQVFLIGIFASQSGRPLMLSAWQFGVTGLCATLAAIFLEPISWEAIRNAGFEIAYAGVFSSGLAFSLQVIGQRYTTAPQAAIFLSSEALFAATFGALILGETITPLGYLGCGIIFLAMMLVEIVPEILSRRSQSHA
ncbi:MAG TPA: DMT family transporter [Ensifer sp.]|nr:DMT family transporter [Ensifer sp.]